MKNIPLKFLGVCFFVDLILIVLLSSVNLSKTTSNIILICLIAILVIIVLIILGLIIFCFKENKKLNQLLDENKYQELLEKVRILKTKKRIFLNERKYYYDYLEMVCLVYFDKQPEMVQSFKEFKKYDYYPASNYYKACYEFSIGNYENIENYYNYFMSISYVKRYVNTTFYDIANLFYCMVLYVNNKLDEALINLKKVKDTNINMPCSKKVIEIIKKHGA